jgi:hypothetical protein
MSRDTEQRGQLDVCERQFKERLLTALHKSASSATITGLFHTSRSRVPGPVVNTDTIELEALGEQIKRLRNQLGEPFDSGVYGRFLEYCAKWDEQVVGEKNGESTLVKDLLQTLKTSGS